MRSTTGPRCSGPAALPPSRPAPSGGQDHLCGNEVTFYPPLTELAHSMPAVALTDTYNGRGWVSPGTFNGSAAHL